MLGLEIASWKSRINSELRLPKRRKKLLNRRKLNKLPQRKTKKVEKKALEVMLRELLIESR